LREYLLGGQDPESAAAVERAYLSDQATFDSLEALELELLADFAAGALPPPQAERMAGRLEQDPVLRRRLDEIRALKAHVEESVGRLGERMAERRPALERYFRRRLPHKADELTGETIYRAFRKMRGKELPGDELARYLYAVAGRVALEEGHDRHLAVGGQEELERCLARAKQSAPPPDAGFAFRRDLAGILAKLPAEECRLLAVYFQGDRRKLVKRLGISPNALRVRVCRIVSKLRQAALEAGRGQTT
jgi:hypothetical protein